MSATFVIVSKLLTQCEQYDGDACGPAQTSGVCLPLRFCYSSVIERWNEAVKAEGPAAQH